MRVEVSPLAMLCMVSFGRKEGRTIFFASWGLGWGGAGGEVVVVVASDIGGGSWDGCAGGC